MKSRHVFSTQDVAAAEVAVKALRQAGIPDDDISLIASHAIENESIPDELQETGGDFSRGGLKGLALGGGTGLLFGLAALAVPTMGLTLVGAAAMALVGAAVGGWSGMLTGTAEPDPVRRKFEDEVAAGRVLVIIDGDEQTLASADAALGAVDATPLPFESPTALT
ncbi:MAG: hypothetical protein M3Y93_06105 [Pseudomonadota bacterium]|nr:hypothetical protein [Pseudomonadota bacterium]